MDEGNEFESIEVNDFESAGIENMDSTPETAEELSLIMDAEVQGLPEEELVLSDDDFLEGDFAAEEPPPEETPDDIPEAVEVPEVEPLPEEIPEDIPEEVEVPETESMSEEVPDMTSEEIPGDVSEEYLGEMSDDVSQPIEESTEDVSAMDAMREYIYEHNYGKEDYETYSKDPEWQELNNRLLEEGGREPIDYGEPSPEEANQPIEESTEDVSAMDAMREYIYEHNYGKEDYETYSKDPEWQELNNRLLEEGGREPIDYGEPSPEETPEMIETPTGELVSDGLPEETPETIESPTEEMVPNEIPAEETVSTWMDNVPMESMDEIPDEISEELLEATEAPEEVMMPEEFPEEIPDAHPEEMPENRPEKSPETIESSTEELVPNEIPAEDTVSAWMDEVAIESTEETELMDDDVELTDDVTQEPIEEITEAENVAEEAETVADLENVSGWLKEVNPNFDPFDLDSPYCNNCGSCAYAVYQRLEGISADSCASAENIGYNSEMEALTGMEQVPMSPAEIEASLLEQGDGAHAIIGIDRAEGPGHWFNAACLDGKVVAIDGQSGEILDWPPDYGDVVNWEMSIEKGD